MISGGFGEVSPRRRRLEAILQEDRDYVARRQIVGVACPFFSPTRLTDGTREQFERGAFSRSLLTTNVYACLDHDPHTKFASLADGTLTLRETPAGLTFHIDGSTPEALAYGLLERAKRWEFSGASIMFRPVSVKSDATVHTVREVDLIDISLSSRDRRPAYAETFVALNDETGQTLLARAQRAGFERWRARETD